MRKAEAHLPPQAWAQGIPPSLSVCSPGLGDVAISGFLLGSGPEEQLLNTSMDTFGRGRRLGGLHMSILFCSGCHFGGRCDRGQTGGTLRSLRVSAEGRGAPGPGGGESLPSFPPSACASPAPPASSRPSLDPIDGACDPNSRTSGICMRRSAEV